MRPVSRNLTIWRFASLFMALAILFAGWQLTPAFAQSPEEDMAQANTHIQQALTAARAGDLDTAKKAYKTYDDGWFDIWFDIEDGVKTKSKETYRAIEQKMGDVSFALSKTPPVASEVITALVALDAQQQAFIKGTAVAATTAASSAATTAAPVATTQPPPPPRLPPLSRSPPPLPALLPVPRLPLLPYWRYSKQLAPLRPKAIIPPPPPPSNNSRPIGLMSKDRLKLAQLTIIARPKTIWLWPITCFRKNLPIARP